MGRRRLYARRRRRTYRSVALSPDVFEGAPSAFVKAYRTPADTDYAALRL
jgi:hypothetical protein